MPDEDLDPPAATPSEDRQRMKAADVLNQTVLLKPTKHAFFDGTDGPGTWEAVECDVWLLDRQGIVKHESGVRFSWKYAIPQLKARIGQFVAGVPKKSNEDNSIVFVPLPDDMRPAAKAAVEEIRAMTQVAEEPSEAAQAGAAVAASVAASEAPFADEPAF